MCVCVLACISVCILGREAGGYLPVNAQGAEAEDSDAHRGFLNERHELADVHSEGPVLCYQLER